MTPDRYTRTEADAAAYHRHYADRDRDYPDARELAEDKHDAQQAARARAKEAGT